MNGASQNHVPLRPCIVIPVYNHEDAVGIIVQRLESSGLPVILVNDGSSPACRQVLEQLADDKSNVELLTLPDNRGKGGAVKAGLRLALQQGFSHGLQIDADGQHDTGDVERFIDQGRQHPNAIVCGCPIYDDSVPRLRYYARYLTHVWIWINSLSLAIKDSMCGFRLYPLEAVVELIDQEHTGDRMDFDPEIMVRWVWRKGQVINVPTAVSYPIDGVSHFAPWRDNALISRMHANLFFGMLVRLPRLLWRKHRSSQECAHG
ncbi:glycosyltransferase family 2 protein [Pseudomaricurvus alkylphenolicus]|jgi:glycosyltransferase involved in cell wall biosynthesis|uniref:glycosyltransferase family 2 protein n=1 Tax=Pseudomaricurvus alkylphenolicus TaxID=1306991 RepID=UPI00141D9D48|nr:glycosyltransferase family 2 protein [Pseudomaricurvus alkylphenolicus]NIB44228.1 glycosyltransferase family 2 protein [Pseudomaricurvus alkylphenolicus]